MTHTLRDVLFIPIILAHRSRSALNVTLPFLCLLELTAEKSLQKSRRTRTRRRSVEESHENKENTRNTCEWIREKDITKQDRQIIKRCRIEKNPKRRPLANPGIDTIFETRESELRQSPVTTTLRLQTVRNTIPKRNTLAPTLLPHQVAT